MKTISYDGSRGYNVFDVEYLGREAKEISVAKIATNLATMNFSTPTKLKYLAGATIKTKDAAGNAIDLGTLAKSLSKGATSLTIMLAARSLVADATALLIEGVQAERRRPRCVQ